MRDATLAWCLRKPSPDAVEGGSSLQELLQSLSSNLGSCDHCYHVSGLRTEDAVVRDPGRERYMGSQLPEPACRQDTQYKRYLFEPSTSSTGDEGSREILGSPLQGQGQG